MQTEAKKKMTRKKFKVIGQARAIYYHNAVVMWYRTDEAMRKKKGTMNAGKQKKINQKQTKKGTICLCTYVRSMQGPHYP